MSTEPKSPPPEVAGFTVVRHLGGGGFADVYLYHQHDLNRQVAVKVLRHEHLNSSSLQQFRDEADIMAGVSQHPFIVSVFTAGVADDGRPYLVMEYYPRPHFGVRARDGQLSVAEALKVGVQVCSAVHTAHESSILHRDIKPSNILTSDYGHPGLTDFGIAGVRRDGIVEEASAVTVPYSPPEILSGADSTGSEVTDVYSLTATVYALVAGRPPHWVSGGDNSQSALSTRVVNHRPPATGRDDTGPLEHLLAMGLSIDPTHRPRTALALAEALQDVELQLQLPPTRIEVRQDRAEDRRPTSRRDTAGENDGTRRAPQVVHSQPATATPAHRAPSSTGASPAGRTAPTDPLTGARDAPPTAARAGTASRATPSVVPVTPDQSDLAVRPTGAVTAGPDADSLTRRHGPQRDKLDGVGGIANLSASHSDSEATRSRQPLRLPPTPVRVVAGLIVVMAMVMVAVVLSGSEASDSTTTTVSSGIEQSEPEPPSVIGAPTDVAVAWDPASQTLGVTWTEPAQAASMSLSYRVMPIGSDGEPADSETTAAFQQQAWEIEGSSAEIDLSGMVGDPPCVAILAIGPQPRGSDYSRTQCP